MNNIRYVRQHDSMECGISCLSMVCKIFDREYNTSELYKICKATKEGVSLKAITETAQTIGIKNVLIVKCYLYVWDHVVKSYWNIMGNGQKIFVP